MRGRGFVAWRRTLLGAVGALLAAFTANAAPPTSDDFDATVLAPFWTFLNPLGDGSFSLTGTGTADARLRLSVPAGTAHDGLQAVRVVQPVDDGDFEVEVKFESALMVRQQHQGVVVEQDASTYIRFYFFASSPSLTRLWATATANGSNQTLIYKDVSPGVPIFLRVARAGDSWSVYYSYDGQEWVVAGAFSRAIQVQTVGVFAGNSATNPAHTAVVDYFFDTASPLVPEDSPPCEGAGPFTLDVDVVGQGSVEVDPDQGTYACGAAVTLTASPDPGSTFAGWSGDVTGSADSVVVSMLGNRSATATFEQDSTPPAISGLQVQAGTTSAVVSWTTDEPATSRVEYGLSTPGEAVVEDLSLVTSHAVTLPGLDEDTTYQFLVQSTDGSNNTASSATASFTTDATGSGGGSGAPESDDFNAGALQPYWTFVNPAGDGSYALTGTGTADARLALTVPAGSSHDGQQAVRVVQAVDDEDFELEVKFDSALAAKQQQQGLLVEQEPGNFLRFYFFYNSSTATRLWATSTANGSTQARLYREIAPGAPLYMRVRRQGDVWEQWYSYDGQNWLLSGAFGRAIEVATVGVFAGNSLQNPAHTALVDYFFNTASPIVPEDGPPCVGQTFTLSVAQVGQGTVARDPAQASYDCGDQVSVSATPAVGWTFGGWSGDATGAENPLVLTMDANTSVTATFVQDTTPPQIGAIQVGPGTTSAVVSWTTDEPATSRVDFGLAAPGESSVQDLALVTDHVVTLTGLQPDTSYVFTVHSEDEGGNPATSLPDTFSTLAPTSCGEPGPFTLSLSALGNGTVSASPALSAYECGQVVTVTPTPAPDSFFAGWSGALTGVVAPATVVIGGDTSISAAFLSKNPSGSGPSFLLFYGSYQRFGHLGKPQHPVNVVGRVSDPNGLGSLAYSLNAGPWVPLSRGKQNVRLVNVGDFNVDLQSDDLQPGPNHLLIRAQDAQGNLSFELVTVEWNEGVTWPETVDVDFAAATQIHDVAQIVDGRWQLQATGIRTLEPGYDRTIAIGDLAWTDFEAEMEFTVHAVTKLQQSPLIGLATRWTGHFDWEGEQPDIGWYPGAFAALGSYRWFSDGTKGLQIFRSNGSTAPRELSAPDVPFGVRHRLKMRTQPVAGGNYESCVKVWRATDPEPSAWGQCTLSGTEAPAGGSLLLVVHFLDVTIHSVEVTPF